MIELRRSIGEHPIRFRLANRDTERYVKMVIGDKERPGHEALEGVPELNVTVHNGYGSAYLGTLPVDMRKDAQGMQVTRTDYRLTISSDFREADIRFHDYFALRTALLNWYSLLIARSDWGIVIHSSCVLNDGVAHLFAGYSGAGKTTVASFSKPRPILADESSLVRILPDGRAFVHDSPFRNDFKTRSAESPVPLQAIYLLKQSPIVKKRRLRSGEAMIALFDKIVYWTHDAEETTRLIRQCRRLVETVPAYELEFQKNDLFWGVLS